MRALLPSLMRLFLTPAGSPLAWCGVQTVIDFDARYPLMGGWKVDFTLGYSVPLKGSLFRKRSDGKRRLTMDISTPLDDVFVEDLIVRVVLPEGARAIATDLPFDMEQSFDTKCVCAVQGVWNARE